MCFILVCSVLALAQPLEEHNQLIGNISSRVALGVLSQKNVTCTFSCKIGKFLFENKAARTGKSWWEGVFGGDALVGQAAQVDYDKLSPEQKMEWAGKCANGDTVACEVVPSIKDVFVAAGYADDPKTKTDENFEARKRWAEGLYKKAAASPGADPKLGEISYEGTEEQNKQLLELLRDPESDLQLPVKTGGQSIDQDTKSGLQQSLGASYKRFEKSLGKIKSMSTRTDGTLIMEGKGGIIGVREDKDYGVLIVERSQGGKLLETSIVKDGRILATQKSDGNVMVGETSYNFPKGKSIDDLDTLAEGVQLPGEEGPSGFMQLDGDVFTAVNYEEETMQKINPATGEIEDLKIDYYEEGASGCSTDGGCYVPTGGEVRFPDASGQSQRYLVDYDYKTSGAERTQTENLEDVEYFNPLTGRQEGAKFADGTLIVAERKLNDQGVQTGYTGEFAVTNPEGLTVKVKKEGEQWVAADPEVSAAEQIAIDELLDQPEVVQELNSRESSSQGALATAQIALESVYKITSNLKSYPAISNLLFGNADFYKKWRSDMDKAFAPMLGSNWFPSAICENDELHWNDIEPEGKAVIKTVSGTYQAVASIQMERSPEASPILCHKNPDQEADELFICDSRQVCVEDSFCYADQDRDNEADGKEPLKGYFYKITWAVSSPQDEALTPFVDENGVAVSFNIFLYPGAVPLYNLNGNIASPIQLQNGASDRDAIIKYSTNLYDQACIRWNQAPTTVNVPGGSKVEDVCFNVVASAVGQVNWERSGQEAASVTVSHGEISRNTEW